jgi:ABC-type nitrate/sulfonate/bicarbonate transport system substrate-binding protein
MTKAALMRGARAAIILVALQFTSPIGLPARAAELMPFRVGMAAPANTVLAIWVAQAAGFYQTQGLQVSIVPMVGGKDAGPALKSGRIQLMHIGMSSVVRANTSGLGDLRCIGSLANVIRSTMFSASKVKTAADLKGGIVGISSAGSESDSTTTLALQRLGLSRSDVVIKEIGVDRLPYVRDGRVAATTLGEPLRSEAFAEGLNPIFDFYAQHIPWLYSGLTVDRAYLQDHRDVLTRFMQATVDGNYLAYTNERRAREVLVKELGIGDPKILNISYANFREATPLNADIDPAGAENILATTAPAGASRNLNDYIDMSLTDSLRAAGFFDAMQKKYGMK